MDARFTELLASLLPLLGSTPLTEETRLRDAGLDSMQAVEVLFGIEEVFGVSLPDEELNDQTFATAGSLWQVVDSALARP
ncbi:phosphopantetheine-binding protein [Saccharothrix sp. ALI-22-I]|uniref:acyl carrier protein n=1 Tax=Saccharothrix sp. ALI-22-I TaxID=1933778 RepID=UPI00097C3714|nr:phosphopantetheine-binding protein [Saccharothrix sp. ALI-22-I]ONI91080.1 phosphopantetheine-binding protein [Saccharothrix sp. ALI-22-I]